MDIKTGISVKNLVKLRTKDCADGVKSLYLDIVRDGQRAKRYLRLYIKPLLPGDSREAREINKQIRLENDATLRSAETIRAETEINLLRGVASIEDGSSKSKLLLLDWLDIYHDRLVERKYKGMHHINGLIGILEKYPPALQLTLYKIDRQFAAGFINFLRNDYIGKGNKKLQDGTIVDYVRTFSIAINAAIKSGYKVVNPFKLLSSEERVKQPDKHREYLTKEELSTLMATPCYRDDVRRAFLFSCFCGLRMSDVRQLSWNHIVTENGVQFVVKKMQKTGKEVKVSLPNKALELLPARDTESDKVFPLPSEPTVEAVLDRWATSAGLTKHVTFHTARHTFATLLVTEDVNILTVSKMLGHTNIKTTQIYSDIIDQKKVAASNKLDELFT